MKPEDVRGQLDGMLLAALESGPLHGYAVIEALVRGSGGHLELSTGTVYPALRRLERVGLADGQWETVGGRRRRTYTITRAGRRELAAARRDWASYSKVVNAVIGGA